MANSFSFLWALIFLYSVIAALLLKTGKVSPSKQVGFSIFAHAVIAVGALVNALGISSIVGVIVILTGVYLHYKAMVGKS